MCRQRVAKRLSAVMNRTIIKGSQIDGLIFFKMTLLGGSNAQYVKKNAVRHWSVDQNEDINEQG
jgi:hypothetical protein